MKKKVYIETTIPSYLICKPSQDLIVMTKKEVTRNWWEFHSKNFDLYTSSEVVFELSQGDEEYSEARITVLDSIKKLNLSGEVEELGKKYVKHFNFLQSAYRDALHIAFSVFYELDVLLTWNWRRLTNADIISELSELNNVLGYNTPIICTPEELFPAREK